MYIINDSEISEETVIVITDSAYNTHKIQKLVAEKNKGV